MSSQSRKQEALRQMCAQAYSDDGVDPRFDKQEDARQGEKPDRKAWQLCKQVARTIELELTALPAADALTGASVSGVEPAPNAGRLRVVIVVARDESPAEVERLLRALAGRLRSAVAAATNRRRVPELVFMVIREEGGDV